MLPWYFEKKQCSIKQRTYDHNNPQSQFGKLNRDFSDHIGQRDDKDFASNKNERKRTDGSRVCLVLNVVTQLYIIP